MNMIKWSLGGHISANTDRSTLHGECRVHIISSYTVGIAQDWGH